MNMTEFSGNITLQKPHKTAGQDVIKSQFDSVNRPAHYADTKIEVIDYIEDKDLGFHLGNVVKYISRAGKKQSTGKSSIEKEIEDLEKAKWYLERRIKFLKERQEDY